MITKSLLSDAQADDNKVAQLGGDKLYHPQLDPIHYYRQIASDPYFQALSYFRHHIRAISDNYFSKTIGACNIDLFLITSSISSPSGPGSDSEPLPLMLGNVSTYLVDSSQFGFEPILIGGLQKAYCYLASMRGEDPDARHLNQFYHCEYEAQCTFEEARAVAEGYIKDLSHLVFSMINTVKKLSNDPTATMTAMEEISNTAKFESINFDEAVALLKKGNISGTINETSHGTDITSLGEKVLLNMMGKKAPIWVTHYHRDRVPFYQKPTATNPDRVLNADLLFPPLVLDGFGGEILGMGQRQDSEEELRESLQRQGISPGAYEWYLDLRRMPAYKTTSGFGLGIERFISWSLGLDSIHKAILYPRIKGTPMTP